MEGKRLKNKRGISLFMFAETDQFDINTVAVIILLEVMGFGRFFPPTIFD